MERKLRLAVLISGGGSNLQAILNACEQPEYPAEVVVVASNRRSAHGLQRARSAGIPAIAMPHKDYPDRSSHERQIISEIERYNIDLLVLAGYMRVVTSVMIDRFFNRAKSLPGVMNIHPADTRAYQGAHGYEYALGLLPENPNRLKQTWITVHFVDAGVDTGPIIYQAPVPVKPNDTIDTLRDRGLAIEHQIYPLVIQWYAENRIILVSDQVHIRSV